MLKALSLDLRVRVLRADEEGMRAFVQTPRYIVAIDQIQLSIILASECGNNRIVVYT